METLKDLYSRLDLPQTQLVITNENTGAGYIATISDDPDKDDKVFARWSNQPDGVCLLSRYVEIAVWLSQYGWHEGLA